MTKFRKYIIRTCSGYKSGYWTKKKSFCNSTLWLDITHHMLYWFGRQVSMGIPLHKNIVNIVVSQQNCCEATILLWGSHIVVRQPYCCEAATFWGSHIVVKQPHCFEAATLLWGILIVVRHHHCCWAAHWCEEASLLWIIISFWGCKIYSITRILRPCCFE